MLSIYCDLGCTDTDSWNNGYAETCSSYKSEWCENEGAKPDGGWALGSTYNYPENNCCVCGKGKNIGKFIYILTNVEACNLISIFVANIIFFAS